MGVIRTQCDTPPDARVLQEGEQELCFKTRGPLCHTVIDLEDAPRGLKGQRVTGKSVAIFLNVSENWFGIAKKIYGELVVSRENPAIADYLAGIQLFGVGVNSVYSDILAITEGAQKQPSPAPPVTRPNKRKRMEEAQAGPSKFGPDHDGQGYTEIDDEGDEDEDEEAAAAAAADDNNNNNNNNSNDDDDERPLEEWEA
ncbi:hypothetical protein GSI_08441 [Ganoderma sinense ZZ0214-1]|uniref:Uncharacterized protein n=1 Tax=Ganoderma sinense ZZ0214-1 TaxID=1077348 RepID=A0A2G8S3V0_9APHY|nr:hypothetical protein GSI_08441 [Ganoderma sinense ZZ0214-1]